MQGRLKFNYKKQEFIEGEFVLINGKDIGYLAGVDKEKDGSETAYVMEITERTDWMPQYCNPWGFSGYRQWYMTKYSSKNGDVIVKADVMEYRLPSKPVKYAQPKANPDFLLDGWVICIVLMIATLVLKPLGAWQLMILGTWLLIRHNEIERVKGINDKKDKNNKLR